MSTGYTEIAAHYRRLIVDGELRPGEVMPSLEQVREQFDVSITTANRAYRVLKDEGLTFSRAGIGTLVAHRPQDTATGVARLERLERTGREFVPGESSVDHVAMRTSLRDPELCRELDVEPGDEVIMRRRVFLRDGERQVVAFSFIHVRAHLVVPEVLQQGQLKPFWQKTYEQRCGKRITRSPERRGARFASADDLNALGIDLPPYAAAPVLVLRTAFHDEDGPIEVWEDIHAPGMWQVASE